LGLGARTARVEPQNEKVLSEHKGKQRGAFLFEGLRKTPSPVRPVTGATWRLSWSCNAPQSVISERTSGRIGYPLPSCPFCLRR
jgi:hypothetical protein